jgi:hypothetical protein
MKKYMPEFMAVPAVIVLLGLVFLVLWALDAGLAAWIVIGAVGLAALIVVTVIAMRRPRGIVSAGGAGEFGAAAARADDGVHRVLVVTDTACGRPDLEAVEALRAENGALALVVAPVLSSRVARWTGDEQAYRVADTNLTATIEALAALGFEASGHVGSHDPLQAADDGLREFPADEILFVLSQDGKGVWLEEGVVEAAKARYPVPVHTVTPGVRAAG